ncbi:helix-turn-helix domain-containing protein [Pectobacterium carotovorum]|uniref:helix-turn-helix domain-containing protein n=1 Tax=Pectobacterium carotovorum TaxID=554 RepID=UPI000506026B|nr:helix-turn-helix domain-containing protein [Pectobacterium carotovorum]KFX01309.1 XRE family transcriptional regulator [Pectobacterium carotovorum subsp. carotovorum]KHT29711.1 XRE family transcriptional regulator [Pectobacterium carotovorum subsp. carotovorum]KML69489.1 XRE family transcriptional regulator [Pectobacterium carotovorum subsp. carotovorum ICMP 5702]MBA0181909.1 helix-turn-helix domain-containing protein [Pectobacterium carotovorum]MBL0906638.1 helix-turn-helix domain-containi
MVDNRLLNIQSMIQRQHAAGTASDVDLDAINRLVAESQKTESRASMDASRVRAIREREKISQSQLAGIINMSANSVQKWERGVSAPTGAALRILEVIERKGLSAIL